MLLESNLWNYADGCDHGFTPCFSAQGLADGTTVGRRAEEVPGISDGAKTWGYLINCFRSSERSTSWILLVFSGSLYIYLDTMHSSMVLVYRMYVYCSTNCYPNMIYEYMSNDICIDWVFLMNPGFVDDRIWFHSQHPKAFLTCHGPFKHPCCSQESGNWGACQSCSSPYILLR